MMNTDKKIFHKVMVVLLFIVTMPALTIAQSLVLTDWSFRRLSTDKWLPAQVPGSVHTDLMQNGVITDPFKNDNEKKVQWVGESDWTYQCKFHCPDSLLNKPQLELVFEGLDTYAEVALNDSLILQADNMFRSWTVDVKKWILKENVLVVRFRAPEAMATAAAKKLPYTLPEGLRSFTRKAQYHYGWDWGPKILSCGIWKPVKLTAREPCAILSFRVVQDHRIDKPTGAIAYVKIKSEKQRKTNVTVKSAGFPTQIIQEVNLRPGIQTIQIPFLFPDAKLWQPNGKGEPHLYEFSCILDDDRSRTLKCSTGFRKAELIREKDAQGESFGFRVNGREVFVKGANIIPPDLFLARVPDQEYEELVLKARNAGMNMLRVWGGGVYLPDVFYEYCDKYGIMVWQDFMFACSMVPGDSAFVENVRQEAKEQVERLSHHPSLFLWCGNNESDEGWHNWGWQKQFNYSAADSMKIWKDYERIFHSVLPALIDSLDPSRGYWPSSPSIGWGRKESMTQGDSHYWGVWWGMEDFEMYKKKTGRFMSEFGFQSLPDVSLWKKVVDTISVTSIGFRNHQKHPRGFETIDNYLERYFNKPESLEDYTYVTQLQQAYGMKMAMDAHRRKFSYCRGTLFWQFNDCWPVISWSALDSREKEKLFYYEAKRSFDSLYISTVETEKGLSTTVHTDGIADKSITLRLYYIRTDKSAEPVLVAENSFKLRPDSIIHNALFFPSVGMRNLDSSNVVFVTEAEDNFTFRILKRDYFYRCRPKNLLLQSAQIQMQRRDSTTLTLATDVFTYGVYLYDDTGECTFSDNGFHLMPGEKKTIKYVGDFSKIKSSSFNIIKNR
jgi:beta-mannosidase